MIRHGSVVAVRSRRRDRFLWIRSRGAVLCCEGRRGAVGKWTHRSVHSAKGVTVEWLVAVRGKRRGPRIPLKTVALVTIRLGGFCKIGHPDLEYKEYRAVEDGVRVED